MGDTDSTFPSLPTDAASAASEPHASAEYDFLVGHLIDAPTLVRATELARQWNVSPHAALISLGWVSPEAYTAAVARSLPLPHNTTRDFSDAEAGPVIMLDSTSSSPAALRIEAGDLAAQGYCVQVAPRSYFDDATTEQLQVQRLDHACRGLFRKHPILSAGAPIWIWQQVAIVVAVGLVVGGALVAPGPTLTALLAFLTLTFAAVVVLRFLLVAHLWKDRIGHRLDLLPEASLPTYTVLVPLFHEVAILPDLLRAIADIDYPPAKLEVLLVLEADDAETLAAARHLERPPFVHIVVVPHAPPRTKPKALNYALQMARGDYIVVYDAEDMPEPDQLRRAAAMFGAQPDLTVVQARLNIYNPRASWLARQFTLEYSALFDIVLPALARMKLPMPLGGTSNYFPRKVLQAAGGWDPYNVTEDADLGIRIARFGGRFAILHSTTWEEAPAQWCVWLPQRTRWLKGWIQTYLVHMRRPSRLLRELGPLGFVGFQAYSGGLILSALAFPLVCLLLAVELWQGTFLAAAESALGRGLWALAAFNLFAGWGSAIVIAIVAVRRRRHRLRLAIDVLLMPIYWLLISWAAYRAIRQLARDPHLWEKTAHTARNASISPLSERRSASWRASAGGW